MKIDANKIQQINYAMEEFFNDVPAYDLLSNFVQLYKESDTSYIGYYGKEDNEVGVQVKTKTNKCYIDYVMFSLDNAIKYMSPKVDPVRYVLDNYRLNINKYVCSVVIDGILYRIDNTTKLPYINFINEEKLLNINYQYNGNKMIGMEISKSNCDNQLKDKANEYWDYICKSLDGIEIN